ncbi:MAG TPA: serine hydrolase [Thermoanaerobaculia bacterium]|nr:serine hydrolase [Thermoanaerobaculia bacterium]
MQRILMGTLFVAAAMAAAAAQPPDGLWAARRDFGPDIRGTLRIAGNRAEIAGRTAPVTINNKQVAFELANGEGAFRGAMRGDRIVGHWIQPATVWGGREYATPVTLARTAFGWAGEVRPLADHMTLLLSVNGDKAFIRNPERNIGRFADVRGVLDHSRFDTDTATLTIDVPPAGGSLDFHRATAADEAVFYPRGRDPKPYSYRKPLQLDDGWPVASLDDVGISRAAIEKFIDKLDAVPIDSVHASEVDAVLIARHGRLVLEEYFHGDDPDEPHDTRSAAKSLTDVLAGAAKLSGSTPVYATMNAPTDDPRKESMTLANLLAQNSGLDCDDDDNNSPGNEDVMQSQTAQPDWYAYTLALKSVRPPGEKSVYCSCQPNLAGGVLQRKTGRWLPDLFRELVAEPMQIRNYGLMLTPTRDAYMGGGVRLTSRDFLKLAQMMMDGGRWNGKQIVSAEWAKQSTSRATMIGSRMYGYLWWLEDYPYQGRKVRAFFAAGNGGQIAMAIPELDLAIGFNGGNYSDPALYIPQREYVPQDILPAVK